MSEHVAGPELDAEVDRVVFGKPWVKAAYCVINGERADIPTWLPAEDWCSPDDPPGGWEWGTTPPRYSTDYGKAMELFEALVESEGAGLITANMEDARGEGFIVSVVLGFEDDALSITGPFPLAVCRAALQAFGNGGS